MSSTGWVTLDSSSIGYFATDSSTAVFTISGGKNFITEGNATIAADSASNTIAVDTSSNVTLKESFIDTTKEITVNGANYSFEVASAAKVNIASGKQLKGSSSSDTLSAANVTLTSSVSILGEGGNDTISVTNSSLGSAGIFSINGGEGNDTVTVNNVTISGGSFNISDTSSGTDLINLSNITLGSGNFTVNAGEGADTVNLSGITLASGAKFAQLQMILMFSTLTRMSAAFQLSAATMIQIHSPLPILHKEL